MKQGPMARPGTGLATRTDGAELMGGSGVSTPPKVGWSPPAICWAVRTSVKSPDRASHLGSLLPYGLSPRVVPSNAPSPFDEAADFGTNDL